VLGAAEQVKTDLEELARLELTPLDALEPELAYLFKHIVTQEVAYESLSAAMRAALHTQLAAYLEARAGTELAPYLDLLAFHYDRGDNLLRRQQYLRKAGEAAVARYANDAAIDYLSRALALASAEALTERFDLLALRELVYGILGERAAQLADLAALVRLAEALDDQRRATIIWRRIEYAFSVADYQTISAFAPAAEALAQRAGAPALAARFAGTLAQALAFYGDVRGAYTQEEEGLRLARAAGDRRSEGYVLQGYGTTLWTEGDHTKARDILEQGMAVSRSCGDLRQAAVTQAWCSAALSDLGDFGAARDYVEASLAFSQLTGDSENIGLAVTMRGQYLLNQGDFQGARTSGEQALAIFQANQQVIMEAAILNRLGRIAAGLHELVSARSYAEQALALARSIGDQQTEAYALADLCRAATGLGDFLTARAAATQASERSAMRGSPSVAAYVQLALALLALWEADCPTAALRAAQLLKTARSAPYPLLEPPGLIVLGPMRSSARGAPRRRRQPIRRRWSSSAVWSSSTHPRSRWLAWPRRSWPRGIMPQP
jgi:tetratricopeptide (TPR) repeat protein